MKRSLLFLIILMFFLISCDDDKKTQMNTDIDIDTVPTADLDSLFSDEDVEITDTDSSVLDEDSFLDDNDTQLFDEDIDNDTDISEQDDDIDEYPDQDSDSVVLDEDAFPDGDLEVADTDIAYQDEDTDEYSDEDTLSDSDFEVADTDIAYQDEDIDAYSYKVLCTGQNKCYNNTSEISCPSAGDSFYGQDAQYLNLYCTAKSFTVSGNSSEEIIIDNNTELSWQRAISELSYIEDAKSYCENLIYAGYEDWRLPTTEELETIVDYSKFNPSVDTNYFTDMQAISFWSVSPYLSYTDKYAWSVSFYRGEVRGYDKDLGYYYKKCVRGDGHLVSHSFVEETVADDVIVTDLSSTLKWTKVASVNKTWEEGLSYCENLDYGSFTDWRLPSINEVKNLLNRNKYFPASDFPNMPGTGYVVSSSTLSTNAELVWNANLYDGEVSGKSKNFDEYIVYCVKF